ncbi:carbohydrate ABC transporter substrate-binding protein, CUT1 family [Micromonospora rhizosphaerae]|uniref:Carbohydrate ABC transporter substrate-binding protein, CUT1 family n=1 Tax=Micromonospora rhizosphaerae TaxID=568872 RepID=A0A1C6TDT3_9ACTN|nr:extracellular solute-binding protein [Micromonospora rhizosphaerae]SCL39702.1 carbohydrate ABC transporter substrate-binding protein, CUT1 family [Micromonospora rhizosphaerae]
MPAARPPSARPGADPGRRRFLGALSGLPLLATGGLAGCGEEEETRVDDGPIELSVFWWGGPKRAEATEQALGLYSQQNPRVRFRVTWQGLTGYYDRLATQAASGNVPDLFQIDDTVLTEYAQREIVLDLSRYVADNRLDLRGVPQSLARYGQVAERTMAVAAAQTTAALVYNRDLLRRLRMPEPRSGMPWREYVEWAGRVTGASGGRAAGTTDPSGDYRALWLWLRGQGAELYQGRQLGFGSAELLDWFEFWQVARSGRATPNAPLMEQADTGDLSHQLVVTGHGAASFAWAHQLPELQRQTGDELGLASFPGSTAAEWARASMYWAVFRGTRHPDVAVDVINFLTTNVAAGRILGIERGLNASLPVRQVVADGITDQVEKQVTALGTAVNDLLGPAPAPPPKGHAKVRTLLIDAAENVRSGRTGAHAAASRFMAQANAALAE